MIYCSPRGNKSGTSAVYELLEYAYQVEHADRLPEIKKSIHGKPYFPELSGIHFSLSHSTTHVLCALSSSPVGCDIESPRKISARALEYFSTPEELALFEPLELWVLKESYVKLFGRTIASIRGLRLSREGGRIIVNPSHDNGGSSCREVIKAPDTSVSARLYRVGDKSGECGCTAAVCSFAEVLPDSVILV